MNLKKLGVLVLIVLMVLGFTAQSQDTRPKLYDPNQDVKGDLKEALAVARQNNKHVLLQVGGNW